MFIETGLPNVDNFINCANVVFASVKVLNHLTAFFDDLAMFIIFKDNFE